MVHDHLLSPDSLATFSDSAADSTTVTEQLPAQGEQPFTWDSFPSVQDTTVWNSARLENQLTSTHSDINSYFQQKVLASNNSYSTQLSSSPILSVSALSSTKSENPPAVTTPFFLPAMPPTAQSEEILIKENGTEYAQIQSPSASCSSTNLRASSGVNSHLSQPLSDVATSRLRLSSSSLLSPIDLNVEDPSGPAIFVRGYIPSAASTASPTFPTVNSIPLFNEEEQNSIEPVTLYQGFRALYPKFSVAPTSIIGTFQSIHTIGLRSLKQSQSPFDTLKSISYLFSELCHDRDRVYLESERLESQRLGIMDRMKQVEDALTDLRNQQFQLRQSMRQILTREDVVSQLLDVLNSRIQEIAKAQLDHEFTIRSIKADSEILASAVRMSTATETHSSKSCIKTLFGHEDSVECIDIDRRYGTLVSGSADKSIRIWDMSTFQCLAKIVGHTGWVRCVQLSGNTLMTGSGDHTVQQYNLLPIKTKVLLSLSDTSKASEPCVSFDFTNLQKQEDERSNEEKESEENEGERVHIRTWQGHTGGITCLQFDSQTLLTGSTDKTIRQWDLESGETLSILRTEAWVEYDEKMDWMIQGNDGSSAPDMWSYRGMDVGLGIVAGAATQPPPAPLSKEKIKIYHVGGSITALQFFKYALATGSADGNLRLWDLRTSKCHRTLYGHCGSITSIRFDSSYVISSSTDKTVKVWDLRSGDVVEEWVFGGGVVSLAFDPWKMCVAAGGRDVRLVDRREGKLSESLHGEGIHTKPVRCVGMVEDWCISGGLDGLVNVWKL